MSKIHLTCEAGEQIPARSQDGKDTGESENAQEVGIFGEHRQEEKKKKKEHDSNTGWENKHFVFEYGKKFS
jgi:hypothetical protein